MWDIIVPPGAGSPGARRILCDVSHIELEFLYGFHSIFELFFSFTGKTYDDIRENGSVGKSFPDFADDMAVFFNRILAVHVDQHLIVAGLNWQVDLFAKAGIF